MANILRKLVDLGKKGGMGMSMHQPGFEDVILLIVGMAIGLYLAKWGISHGYIPTSFFCPAPAAVTP